MNTYPREKVINLVPIYHFAELASKAFVICGPKNALTAQLMNKNRNKKDNQNRVADRMIIVIICIYTSKRHQQVMTFGSVFTKLIV